MRLIALTYDIQEPGDDSWYRYETQLVVGDGCLEPALERFRNGVLDDKSHAVTAYRLVGAGVLADSITHIDPECIFDEAVRAGIIVSVDEDAGGGNVGGVEVDLDAEGGSDHPEEIEGQQPH